MAAGKDWLRENLGIIGPKAVPREPAAEPGGPEPDLAREIIDFDSDDTPLGGQSVLRRAHPKPTDSAKFKPIPWPKGLAPTPHDPTDRRRTPSAQM